MTLLALGLNHKTAPIDIRERLSFGPAIVVGALRSLAEQAGAGEAVIVSTCNRTELYCAAGERREALAWLAQYHQVGEHDLRPYLYTLPREEAVRHAFRVASGLAQARSA